MVTKPSNNLRRELKWLRETDSIQRDKDLILSIINKKITNKRVRTSTGTDTRLAIDTATGLGAQVPRRIGTVGVGQNSPANGLSGNPAQSIAGVNGPINEQSSGRNTEHSNILFTSTQIRRKVGTDEPIVLEKPSNVPNNYHVTNGINNTSNINNINRGSNVRPAQPPSISTIHESQGLTLSPANSSPKLVLGEQETINLQQKLITALKKQSVLLIQKCEILGSVTLSKLERDKRIKDEVEPQLSETSILIKDYEARLGLELTSSQPNSNYTFGTYNSQLFASGVTMGTNPGRAAPTTTNTNTNILPSPPERPINYETSSSIASNNIELDLIEVLDDDDEDDDINYSKNNKNASGVGVVAHHTKDSDFLPLNTVGKDTAKDDSEADDNDVTIISQGHNPDMQQELPVRRLRNLPPVNYRIPERDDPLDYHVGKPLSTQDIDHQIDSCDEVAEEDDVSDYLSTRDGEMEQIHQSDLDFVVDDSTFDMVSDVEREYVEPDDGDATSKTDIEVILSSPLGSPRHEPKDTGIEEIDLLDDDDYEPHQTVHPEGDKPSDFANTPSQTGYEDHGLVFLADQESRNGKNVNDGDNNDVDDDDDLSDSDLEKFDEERENMTQVQRIKELDDDLKIIAERSLINESALEPPSQLVPLIKQEKQDSFNKGFSEDDEEDFSLLNDISTEAKTDHTGDKESDLPENGLQRYPWTEEVYFRLHEVFKLPGFRSNQLEAINAILDGKDVFVLMPTGGGKSLCYQLPAVVQSGKTKGTTIVISPLISLMQDQVEHLLALNIKACMFSSKGTSEERRQTFNLFINGFLDMIYISPEMISASEQCKRAIRKLHDNGKLARIVVDEAHCVSSWGHDFRPDYQELKFFKDEFPDVPMMALTATASEHVRMDIIHNLHLKDPVFLKQSFNRTNLFYTVKRKTKNTVSEICNEIKTKFKNQTGIIYCHSKSSCEHLCAQLQQNGIRCSFYHAGMEPDERLQVQQAWQSDRVQVICATVAFGMGIDKPDVRFVYHFTVPRTLEGYYQETGRAGRDGKFSYCTTYFSFKDIRTIQTMIQKDENLDRESKEHHLMRLQQVLAYCDNVTDCRRKLVLKYFNEDFDENLCNKNCDNCLNKANIVCEERDVTEMAKTIAKLVQRIQGDRVTLIHCQDIIKGSKSSRVVKAGHANLEEHGSGKSISKSDIERIFFHLVSMGVLKEYSIMNNSGFASSYVRVGPNVRKLLNGELKVRMQFSVQSKSSRPSTSESSTGDAYSASNPPVAHRRGNSVEIDTARPLPGFINARDHLRAYTYGEGTPINLKNNEDVRSTQELSEVTYAFNKLKELSLNLGNRMNPPVSCFLPDIILKKVATFLPVNEEEFAHLPFVNEKHCKKFKYFKPTIMELRKRRVDVISSSEANRSIVISQGSSIQDPSSSYNPETTKSRFFASLEKSTKEDEQILEHLRNTQSLASKLTSKYSYKQEEPRRKKPNYRRFYGAKRRGSQRR